MASTISGVAISDKQGTVVYVSHADEFGGITVTDARGEVVKYFSPSEVAAAR